MGIKTMKVTNFAFEILKFKKVKLIKCITIHRRDPHSKSMC